MGCNGVRLFAGERRLRLARQGQTHRPDLALEEFEARPVLGTEEHPRKDMVLEPLADAFELDLLLHPRSVQLGLAADAGAEEQLRGAERPEGDDDVLLCARDVRLAAVGGLLQLDADAALRGGVRGAGRGREEELGAARRGEDREVRARVDRWGQVRRRGGGALALGVDRRLEARDLRRVARQSVGLTRGTSSGDTRTGSATHAVWVGLDVEVRVVRHSRGGLRREPTSSARDSRAKRRGQRRVKGDARRS